MQEILTKYNLSCYNFIRNKENNPQLQHPLDELHARRALDRGTNKEETNMARFEINGTIYEANEAGNYFYKSTGLTDKKGNPIMKRVSRAIYEQAFEEYTQTAKDEAEEWETEMEEAKENAKTEQDLKDRETEENFNKKHNADTAKTDKKPQEKKVKAPRKSKNIAFEMDGVTLTDKQVDFIREAQQTSFYENGVQSTLWCDVLVDEIGGEFAGKPMTVGAMISTLKEKNLIFVAFEKVNGKKSKYFGFTELGKKIVEGLK